MEPTIKFQRSRNGRVSGDDRLGHEPNQSTCSQSLLLAKTLALTSQLNYPGIKEKLYVIIMHPKPLELPVSLIHKTYIYTYIYIYKYIFDIFSFSIPHTKFQDSILKGNVSNIYISLTYFFSRFHIRNFKILSWREMCQTNSRMDEQPNINMSFQVEGIITFNSFGAKCHLPLFFNKLLLEKKFIRKIERLNVKQRRFRWDGSYEPSHLDLRCLQNLLLYRLWQWKSYSKLQLSNFFRTQMFDFSFFHFSMKTYVVGIH